MWGRRRRRSLEKINNVPVPVLVGPRGGEQIEIALREPTMYELLGFLEGSIEKLVPVYSQKWAIKKVAKVAEGRLDAGDFKLLQPAYEPICAFIARCAEREDLKETLHKILTPAQFVRCVNALLFLVDVEELAVNFTQALARVSAASKEMKRAS